VWTGAVFDGDEFDYRLGDSPFVNHKPQGESDPGKLTHVYAIGRQKGTDYPVIEVWPVERVRKHRDRYNKLGTKHYSHQNWEMYARKVVLLQVLKYLPASPELAQAIALNDAAEVGRQGLTVHDAIAGTWTPVPQEEEPQTTVQQPRPTSDAPPAPAGSGAPIAESPLRLIRAQLGKAEITEAECCKHFGIEKLEDLTMDRVNVVFAWISNPGE
jgi:recombination protein RecT